VRTFAALRATWLWIRRHRVVAFALLAVTYLAVVAFGAWVLANPLDMPYGSSPNSPTWLGVIGVAIALSVIMLWLYRIQSRPDERDTARARSLQAAYDVQVQKWPD
jgi:hypothetical protein